MIDMHGLLTRSQQEQPQPLLPANRPANRSCPQKHRAPRECDGSPRSRLWEAACVKVGIRAAGQALYTMCILIVYGTDLTDHFHKKIPSGLRSAPGHGCLPRTDPLDTQSSPRSAPTILVRAKIYTETIATVSCVGTVWVWDAIRRCADLFIVVAFFFAVWRHQTKYENDATGINSPCLWALGKWDSNEPRK